MQVVNGVLNICTAIGVFIMLLAIVAAGFIATDIYTLGKTKENQPK